MAPVTGLDHAAEILDAARCVAVLTGAGISTDSGIPDFRGPDGLWTKDPDAEKLATIDHYLSDPEIRRRAWRRRVHTAERTLEPNAGHRAVVELERQGRLARLVTQNVDGLHLAAGSSPDLVTEIHGSSRQAECVSCRRRWPIDVFIDRVRAGEEDPPCPSCGGIVKTAVVFFGEGLDMVDIDHAEEAANACDVILAVGTTLAVYPAAGMVPIALRAGAACVIVNGSATDMDHLAAAIVRGSISEVLPVLVDPTRRPAHEHVPAVEATEASPRE